MEAHHCDRVEAGGARHAGNILLLCSFHHDFMGNAVSRAEVISSLRSMVDRKITFSSDGGNGQTVSGKLVVTHPPQRDYPIPLFFTLEHLEYWRQKASEEGVS